MAINQDEVRYERAMTKLHETFPTDINQVYSAETKALEAAVQTFEDEVQAEITSVLADLNEGASGQAADQIKESLGTLQNIKIEIES